ncbi:MAG: PAAR-like domain-containing protein [Pirellulaceae bacterium]
MAADVFANGREVACKAASGKSVAAFPDACWSPPVPPPTGAPIPYPNTAFARDTAQGTRTVSIRGKEAMIKNRSYFKTSTGDEAATPALQKGVVSRQIRGKCYFTSWSMNVKFEGLNVDRHLDLTTHNHGSPIANTPPFPYVDRMKAVDLPGCEDQKKKIDDACKDAKDRECPSLEKFETYKDFSEIMRTPTQLKNKVKSLEERKGNVSEARSKLRDALGEAKGDLSAAQKHHRQNPIAKLDAKVEKARKNVGSARGKKAKEQAATDLRAAMKERREAKQSKRDKNSYDRSKQKLREAQQEVNRLQDRILGKEEKLSDIKEDLTKKKADHQEAEKKAKETEDKHKQSRKEWRGAASEFADAVDSSPCQRALRCVLSPYNPSKCCPGQTGHHLVPTGSFFHRGRGDRKIVDKDTNTYQTSAPVLGTEAYDADAAPCICVEGQDSRLGSHGLMHTVQGYKDRKTAQKDGQIQLNLTEYAKRVQKYTGGIEKPPKLAGTAKLLKPDGSPPVEFGFSPTATTTYGQAKANGIAAVQEVFPDSGCDAKCLEAQLDRYHKACGANDQTVIRSIVAGKLEGEKDKPMTDEWANAILGDAKKTIRQRREKLGLTPPSPARPALPRGGKR